MGEDIAPSRMGLCLTLADLFVSVVYREFIIFSAFVLKRSQGKQAVLWLSPFLNYFELLPHHVCDLDSVFKVWPLPSKLVTAQDLPSPSPALAPEPRLGAMGTPWAPGPLSARGFGKGGSALPCYCIILNPIACSRVLGFYGLSCMLLEHACSAVCKSLACGAFLFVERDHVWNKDLSSTF